MKSLFIIFALPLLAIIVLIGLLSSFVNPGMGAVLSCVALTGLITGAASKIKR